MKSFLNKVVNVDREESEGLRLPSFTVEDRYLHKFGVEKGISNDKFLRELCRIGMEEKGLLSGPNKDTYIKRIDRELSLFEELGYVDYFLLIWDVVNFAREKDIAVGIGRGSGVSSLTLYSLGITGVDPIRFDLIFERFVSRARAKSTVIDGVRYFAGDLPDVDIDFCYVRRPEVLNYIKNRFSGKTCKVLTVGTLQGKVCIKEACKTVGGYDDASATVVSNKVAKSSGTVQRISEAVKEGLKDWVAEERKEFQRDDNAEIARIARKLEGLPKNFGVHASAMGVSYYDLDGYCPVQLTRDGELVSSYTKKDVEDMLVKVDVLGLKTMTVLDRLSKATGTRLEDIDIDDPEIYQAIVDWGPYTYGLFQLEGFAASGALQKIKPEKIEDLSAINALARPGGMAYIDGYSTRKAGFEKAPELHPELDKITADTFGYIIYQEQIMRAFHDVFGFTLEDAEIIRRVIGKKDTEKVKEWKPKIIEAGKEKGISEEITEDFWKAVEASSNYSFNASHAIAYSFVGYFTAYFKAKHTALFFNEYLKMAKYANTADGGPQAEISKIVHEMKHFGIQILPPDLLTSDMDFMLDDGNSIRYGLMAIKGIAEKKIEALTSFKDIRGGCENKFEILQAAKGAGLTIGDVSALIQAGALSFTTTNTTGRCYSVMEAQTWNVLTDREKRIIMGFGEEFDYNLFKILKYIVENEKTDGKKRLIADSRYETIKKKCEKFVSIFNLNKKYEDIANWFFEKKLLGYSYSGSLFISMSKRVGNLMRICEFEDESDGTKCNYVGIVTEVKDFKANNGENMLRLNISDTDGDLTVLFYGRAYDDWVKKNTLENGKKDIPKKESIVVISGQKSGDTVFLDKLFQMGDKIYLKLGEARLT